MASNSNCEPHTPPRETKPGAFDTIRRARFFDAWDNRAEGEGVQKICKRPDISIAPSTGRKWLKQREELGSPALRRTRKLSFRLGRKSTISEETLDDLMNENNPLNSQPYETIIIEKDLPVSAHTLQQNFSKRKGAKRFKKPRSKAISKENKGKRVQYGQNHKKETITSFWQ
jgi:heat shock protein HspQ